jgi:hypothetical protein
MLAESLPNRPPILTVQLRTVQNAPLPIEEASFFNPAASVWHLSPVTFSVPRRLTSELLRFL